MTSYYCTVVVAAADSSLSYQQGWECFALLVPSFSCWCCGAGGGGVAAALVAAAGSLSA